LIVALGFCGQPSARFLFGGPNASTAAAATSLRASHIITTNSGSISEIVASQPAGTVFSLACGLYRMQKTIFPLPGDSFIGAGAIDGVPKSPPCAMLNGSVVLKNWTAGSGASAGTWYGTLSSAETIRQHSLSRCNSNDLGCEYPQDLFFNSAPRTHVTASFPPAAGQWYLDYTGAVGEQVANTVYVGDDPTGSTVELSVIRAAFAGFANNISIQNLTIEKYASPIQRGAITASGNQWIIKNNWLALNHGAGIRLSESANALIAYNRANRNGEIGIDSSGGVGNVFSNNVVTQNNFAGTIYGFEAGGGKFSTETGVEVINNIFSYNNGNGIWGDTEDTNAFFSGNTVAHNLINGITYEVSHTGTIVRNTLIDNAQRGPGQCIAPHIPILSGHDVCTGLGTCSGGGCTTCTYAKAEIWLHTSDTSTVGGSVSDGNKIISNCGGIQIREDNRLNVTGNTVSHNTLILHTGSAVISNILGGWSDHGGAGLNMYLPLAANLFDYNSYTFDSLGAAGANQWQWHGDGPHGNQRYDWAGWQAEGQDQHGSISP